MTMPKKPTTPANAPRPGSFEREQANVNPPPSGVRPTMPLKPPPGGKK
jgi:hypothetical protein